MAAEGLGIAMTPLYVVQPFVSQGKLRLLLEDYETTVFPLHAVYPANRPLVARMRALVDHLVSVFAR